MIPTKLSESLTLSVLVAQIYSHSRRPEWRPGLATWDQVQKYCVFCEGFGTLARLPVTAVVRGRPSGLPVSDPGSPTCVQLPPNCLATIEWLKPH